MKVLLDENLDHALRNLLGHHEVVTVTYVGWAGLQNGELLRTARNCMDVLPTGDKTLNLEQNLVGRRSATVARSAIKLPTIRENPPKTIAAIEQVEPGSFQTVECGALRRKRSSKSVP